MNSKTKKITTIAMLCAITYVVMAVGRIPIVLFLKYDPSDVIVTLGGLIWGPMTSCIVSVVVATIEMVTVSDTGILGKAELEQKIQQEATERARADPFCGIKKTPQGKESFPCEVSG